MHKIIHKNVSGVYFCLLCLKKTNNIIKEDAKFVIFPPQNQISYKKMCKKDCMILIFF